MSKILTSSLSSNDVTSFSCMRWGSIFENGRPRRPRSLLTVTFPPLVRMRKTHLVNGTDGGHQNHHRIGRLVDGNAVGQNRSIGKAKLDLVAGQIDVQRGLGQFQKVVGRSPGDAAIVSNGIRNRIGVGVSESSGEIGQIYFL